MSESAISCDEVIDFIRKFHGIRARKTITANSLLEDDLGITGDDGSDLLEALQRHFKISFIDNDGSLRATFGLANNEYLFHSEGLDVLYPLRKLLNWNLEKVYPLTVGRLHQVIVDCSKKQ